MDEDQYRATYHEVNKRRCVFEKALNSRVCACDQSRRFNIADREGVACKSQSGQEVCDELIRYLRHNARFTLGMNRISGPLPHAREIKVQNGGLLGLQKVLFEQNQDQGRVSNIYGLLVHALKRFGSLEQLPFDIIIKSVSAYQGRRRRPRRV